MEGSFTQNTGRENNYLYNGKELDADFGLNWYHYGFRMYDPAIARFTGVDPISDKFPELSTYNYASNSPIANIDLHGLQSVFFVASDGIKTWSDKKEGISNEERGRIADVLNSGGGALENFGDKGAAVMYGAAFFTDGATLPVAGLLEGVSLAGAGLQVAGNLVEGNYAEAGAKFGVELATFGIGKKLEGIIDAEKSLSKLYEGSNVTNGELVKAIVNPILTVVENEVDGALQDKIKAYKSNNSSTAGDVISDQEISDIKNFIENQN